MKRFETIDHTADVGIRVYGASRRQLFENAAVGMFTLMVDPDTVAQAAAYTVSAEAPDGDSLLVEWLNELLFLAESRAVLLSRFELHELGETRLSARVFGEPADPGRHRLETEIKAATYHMLRVSRDDGTWSAEIIFDV